MSTDIIQFNDINMFILEFRENCYKRFEHLQQVHITNFNDSEITVVLQEGGEDRKYIKIKNCVPLPALLIQLFALT